MSSSLLSCAPPGAQAFCCPRDLCNYHLQGGTSSLTNIDICPHWISGVSLFTGATDTMSGGNVRSSDALLLPQSGRNKPSTRFKEVRREVSCRGEQDCRELDVGKIGLPHFEAGFPMSPAMRSNFHTSRRVQPRAACWKRKSDPSSFDSAVKSPLPPESMNRPGLSHAPRFSFSGQSRLSHGAEQP
jgi:hypothetical protein